MSTGLQDRSMETFQTYRKAYPFGTALSLSHSYYLDNTIRAALPATTRPTPFPPNGVGNRAGHPPARLRFNPR